MRAEKSLKKSQHRTRAKMVLFLKVFGGGVNAAADLIECSEHVASKLLDDYDAAFPIISKYLQDMIRLARRQGYIVDSFGRRISVDPDAPYRAVNYKVQGGAASFLKDRMIAVDKYLKEVRKKAEGYMVMTIHDELVIEVRREHAFPWFVRKIKRIMEDHTGHFRVDTDVTVARVSRTWADKEPLTI